MNIASMTDVELRAFESLLRLRLSPTALFLGDRATEAAKLQAVLAEKRSRMTLRNG